MSLSYACLARCSNLDYCSCALGSLLSGNSLITCLYRVDAEVDHRTWVDEYSWRKLRPYSYYDYFVHAEQSLHHYLVTTKSFAQTAFIVEP